MTPEQQRALLSPPQGAWQIDECVHIGSNGKWSEPLMPSL